MAFYLLISLQDLRGLFLDDSVTLFFHVFRRVAVVSLVDKELHRVCNFLFKLISVIY